MEFIDRFDGDLCIGPFQDSDAPAFAQAARDSVQSLSPWMPWCHADYSEAEARAWIAQCAAQLANDSAYDLGIYSADRATLIGGIAINQISRAHNYGNVGYWVRASHQRRGIATRAVRVISAFGFDTLKLSRLEIVVALGNEASRAVATKAGAVFECFARRRLVLAGVAHDAAVHSLLPADLK